MAERRKGWRQAERLKKTEYGAYLKRLLNER
jgi:hypothetical protein